MPDRLCPTCSEPVDSSGTCQRCDTQVQSRTKPAPSSEVSPGPEAGTPEFPGYQVIRHIGEGGMGAVYLAEDTTLGRNVAIKVVSRRGAADAQSKSRFMREARAMATIEHPHVVRVYSFGESGGSAYIVMEYVEGETLGERIVRQGKLPVDEALRITRQIVEGLEAAWDRKIIHRDIKPSNILFDRRGQVRVADFGLAKPMHLKSDVSLTQTGSMVGTPHYVSPEQAEGREVDFRSDIYSLGIMLYQMITGECPFDGSTPVAIVAKHLHQVLPSVRLKRPDVAPRIEKLIEWMTAKKPEERPPSFARLLDVIDATPTSSPSRPLPSDATIELAPAARESWSFNISSMPIRKRVATAGIAALAILFLLGLLGLLNRLLPQSGRKQPAGAAKPHEKRLVVAVAPFYGPDEDSVKEGRVMAALIERAVLQRLGTKNARVIGIDETKSPVRDHDQARELGSRLGANVVIWGEAFALRKETEIQPHLTVVRRATSESKTAEPAPGERLAADAEDPMRSIEEHGAGGAVKLESEAPNQIELRKTSAAGVGDVVMLLAAMHALDSERDAARALELFKLTPRTAETLRYEAKALLQQEKKGEAISALEQARALDPTHAGTHATLGDLYLATGRFEDAVAAFATADQSGQPYTSSRGFLQGGRLYFKDTFRSELFGEGNKEMETIYLLAKDPKLQRVIARYPLPGLAVRFEREGRAMRVVYQPTKDSPETEALLLRDGKFDKPLWPPANLLWRMRSMKSGGVLAANFLGGIRSVRNPGDPPGKFALAAGPGIVYNDVPKTLPDLEIALRAAAERDPTQPWHPFFLAMTLDAQGRKGEADTTLQGMLRRDYPGTPYYELNWMMQTAERTAKQDWTDLIFPKALAQRARHPQPPGQMLLFERLINASFVRQAALNRDMRYAHRGLVQARQLTGQSLEGDDLAAAAWLKYFRETGDLARAKEEEKWLKEARANPMNFLAQTARADYALTWTIAALIAFVVLLTTLVANASRRAKALERPWNPLTARIAGWIGAMPAAARTMVIGTAMAITLLAGAWFYVLRLWEKHGLVFAVMTLLIVSILLRSQRIRFVDIVAALRPAERVVLTLSYLLLVAGMIALSLFIARIGRVAAVPIGFGDSLGHATIVKDFEDRLKLEPSSKALKFATAVANHYSGNFERAKQLYDQSDSRARNNFVAATNGVMPVSTLSSEDLFAAYVPQQLKRVPDSFSEFMGQFGLEGFIDGVLFTGVFTILAVLSILVIRARTGPVADPPPPPDRWYRRALYLLIPGAWDATHGLAWRGLATTFCIVFGLFPILTILDRQGRTPAPGPISAIATPNYESAIPLPFTPGKTILEYGRIPFYLALPYATLFYSAVGVALLVGLALHLSRVPAILRRAPAEPTALAGAAPSES